MMKVKHQHAECQHSLELLSVSEMQHPPGSRIYAHARKTFGLIYVLSGSAVYEFDGIPYPVKAGQLFCIPQKLPFSMRPIEKSTYHTRQFGLMIYTPKLYMQMQTLLSNVKDLGRVKLLAAKVEMRPDAARTLCDTVKASSPDTVAVFAAVSDGKLNFVCAAGADAVKAGAHAGKIVGEISAICGGKGGGRPDSAMSGGKDLSKIAEALLHAEEMLKAL